MPLIIQNGKLLIVNGKLAVHQDCCCEQGGPCPTDCSACPVQYLLTISECTIEFVNRQLALSNEESGCLWWKYYEGYCNGTSYYGNLYGAIGCQGDLPWVCTVAYGGDCGGVPYEAEWRGNVGLGNCPTVGVYTLTPNNPDAELLGPIKATIALPT